MPGAWAIGPTLPSDLTRVTSFSLDKFGKTIYDLVNQNIFLLKLGKTIASMDKAA